MKKSPISAVTLVVVGLFLVTGGGLVWVGFFGKYNPNEIEKELVRKERELKRYQSEQRIPPTPEAYAMLEKISEKLSSDLNALEKMTQRTRVAAASEGAVMDGLFFREQLFKIDKDLQMLASERGVVLPGTLGFSDELPDVKRVPLLIQQLLALQEIALALVESGAVSLSVIKPLELVEYKNPATNKSAFTELPVQVAAECDFSALVSALIRIRNNDQVLVVREVQIKTKEEGMLQVQLIASGFSITEQSE